MCTASTKPVLPMPLSRTRINSELMFIGRQSTIFVKAAARYLLAAMQLAQHVADREESLEYSAYW